MKEYRVTFIWWDRAGRETRSDGGCYPTCEDAREAAHQRGRYVKQDYPEATGSVDACIFGPYGGEDTIRGVD